jgi:flagellar assembly protein FliH
LSNFIPKEQLTAYQRWELTSFGDDRPSTVERTMQSEAEKRAERERRAAEEARQAAHAAALEEGRKAGFEQGRKAGFEQGRAEGLADARAQLEREAAQLHKLAESFGAEVAQASERIAGDVIDLALDLSKAMLKNALAIRPELVVPVVADAIRHLPTVQQPALLMLHPDDARLVGDHLSRELAQDGWRIVDDAQIERGGCRVETASNLIDASAPTRWQRIAASLGKDGDWLAP